MGIGAFKLKEKKANLLSALGYGERGFSIDNLLILYRQPTGPGLSGHERLVTCESEFFIDNLEVGHHDPPLAAHWLQDAAVDNQAQRAR